MIDPIEDPLNATARLLADHDSLLAQDDQLERDAEVADRVAWAWGQMSIVDRCAGAIGRKVTLEVVGLGRIDGQLAGVGSNWIELRTDRGTEVVVTDHIEAIVGLHGASRLPEDAPKTERSHDLRQLIRGYGQRDGRLEFSRATGTRVAGRPIRVGADHVDIELPDGQSTCLSLSGVALVRVV